MTIPRGIESGAEPGRLDVACQPGVVLRALGYAVVVGAILITINHADAILRGDITAGRLTKMGLTVIVPYVVSTLSSVGATRAAWRAARTEK